MYHRERASHADKYDTDPSRPKMILHARRSSFSLTGRCFGGDDRRVSSGRQASVFWWSCRRPCEKQPVYAVRINTAGHTLTVKIVVVKTAGAKALVGQT
jgi:hypothetical protein